MKYAEAKYGRVFILRLEDGDILHETLEGFALKKDIKAAGVLLVGGADEGSRIIVGPEEGRSAVLEPMEYILGGVHEAAGVGTIFINQDNKPVLHMHASFGRCGETRTGCVRGGVKIWHVGEVIIFEISDSKAIRKKDKVTGFELLNPLG